MTHLPYFEQLAEKRINKRSKHSYYWNDIRKQCSYFIHATDSVLEVGCGTGELLNEINCTEKTGIDFSPAMIGKAKGQFPAINFHAMSAENISLTKQYDVIILSN